MSFQILSEHDQDFSDSAIKPHDELHVKALEYNPKADGDRVSYVQQSVPRRLPWYGLAETKSTKDNSTDTSTNTDALPVQFELHSNTKTHQLGGVYESYSALMD